jgi:uncharacterized protein with HEPN domain
LTSSEKILRYTQGKSFEDFISNEILIDAVVRNLEIIGKAVKGVPARIRRKYVEVDWKKIAGLRDIITHEYFRVDYEIIWDIVSNKAPALSAQIRSILEKEKT